MIDNNGWADFWRYEKGLNIFPADTRNKKTYEEWSKWQNEPISDKQHEEWKKNDSFANGMAIMAGNVWHRLDLDDYHLCFIDLDNQKAIEEVCRIFGAKDLKELSQITIVEQHPDNKSKAHLYFYTQHVLKKKSSDATRNLKDKLDSNELPAIEVKCQSDGLAYCTPSPHQNGSNYEIIGTKNIGIVDGKEIEDKLFEVYEKYGLLVGTESKNGKTSKIPIEVLLKPDFIIEAGHNRHEAVLRVIEHYYLKYRESKSFDEIYDISWKWNLNHCNPPLSQSNFERQINDGLRFVDKTNVNYNQQTILLQRQNQYEQQLKTDSDKIYKIVSCLNNVPRAYYIDYETGQICYGALKEYGINLEKCIIDIAPKKIRYYNNPLFPSVEAKIELEYQDGNELRKLGPYASIIELLKALENKGYILNRNKAADAFNSVVSAMREKGEELVEYITDVTTFGYYLLDGKLVMKNISQSNNAISKKDAAECCNLLDILSSGWKNKDVFPTVIKWGLISPFIFIIKSNTEELVPWLQMFGWGKSGKTTLGMLVYMIWNRSTKLKKGFSNIDTIPRLGETISKDTYPVLVNEVGSLYETGRFNRYKSISDTIKHGVESTTVRGKFIDPNRYEELPALSPLILTSNYAPNNDGGFGRRFISIHFPKDEKKEVEEEDKFKKLLQDKKKYLKILGDFAMQYVSKDPSVLLKDDWKNITRRILIEFYQFAGKEVPEWIEYFIEQKDAVDESSEKTMFALRAFLVDKINSAYSRNSKNSDIFSTLEEKLGFCLDHALIPFLVRMTKRGGSDDGVKTDTIVITHDILEDISNGWNKKIENITALKDIGVQLGFAYDGKYLNGKKTKVVFGPISKLYEFINPKIVFDDTDE
ncbi:MAG: hypothetical protein AB7U98_09645 [Candidatus Nitrosocosmicus sp.]